MKVDLWLEECFASVVRYIQDRTDDKTKLYFDNIPEDFFVPSIYFPVPRTNSVKVTLQTFLTDIHMEIWFMASTDSLAYTDAANIRDCILLDNCAVDIMKKDGRPSGRKVRLDNVETMPVATGVVKLTFAIKNYFCKNIEETEADKYVFTGLIRPRSVQKTWYAATTEQRKEEEVQKKCLKKALESL